jgi:beta-lactamase class A
MSQQLIVSENFLRRKISPFYSLGFILGGIIFIAFGLCLQLSRNSNRQSTIISQKECASPTNYRMKDFTFTNPLLLSDIGDESTRLQPLKQEINVLIEAKKRSGELSSAAVHVINLNDAEWICINDGERFNPGTLFKVPVLMILLRQSERNPELMDKKLFLDLNTQVQKQTFIDKHIETGKYYTIRELIFHMIVESDNYATHLLNQYVHIKELNTFFDGIGLPTAPVFSEEYTLSVKEYSRLLTVLYNASYLYNENADYALSLLSQSKFNEGMTKFLPLNFKVAHKFGEAGNTTSQEERQFHETGIIYLEEPILINVMTKGKDVKVQANVIAEIGKLVYERLSPQKAKAL